MGKFPMRTTSIFVASVATLIAACGNSGPSADQLNRNMSGATSGGTGGSTTVGSGPATGSGGAVASTSAAASSGGAGATTGSGTTTGSGGAGATSGTGGSGTGAGGDGGGGAVGGTGGDASGGTGGQAQIGPYDPRSGPFKMLVYSRTVAFRHDGSIASGKAMLQEIASEQGFEVMITEDNTLITAEGLAQFEIVFFMNPTGDIFNAAEQQVFEDWIANNGAFAGTHSATDTEEDWTFYKEVTGQYYNGHGPAGTAGGIQFEASALDHPALRGLPNPWQRNEEWYIFSNAQQWSTLPGFLILGRKQADNQPIMWVREWGNFRAFYTALGHDAVVFEDPDIKKHVTGGIMWAVRREHLIP